MNATAVALFLTCCAADAGASRADVSAAKKDGSGILTHDVQSPYQVGTTRIRVLTPDNLTPSERYPAVYLLPVEAGSGVRFGDGLMEVKRLGLHNKYQAIFVMPTFSQAPFLADHPTDPSVRQETYVTKVVVPFVDRHFPVISGTEGRLLLGFSKAGYGAFSLLLRNPEMFGRAAAWDSPLMRERFPRRAGSVFGSQENFETYQVSHLLREKASSLSSETRLHVMGYSMFREHAEQAHTLMDELAIPHGYDNSVDRRHRWDSGWLPIAVGRLLSAE